MARVRPWASRPKYRRRRAAYMNGRDQVTQIVELAIWSTIQPLVGTGKPCTTHDATAGSSEHGSRASGPVCERSADERSSTASAETVSVRSPSFSCTTTPHGFHLSRGAARPMGRLAALRSATHDSFHIKPMLHFSTPREESWRRLSDLVRFCGSGDSDRTDSTIRCLVVLDRRRRRRRVACVRGDSQLVHIRTRSSNHPTGSRSVSRTHPFCG